MMKNRFIKLIILLSSLLLIFALAGCGSEPPPDDGTKEPAALNGEFECRGFGRFTFDGDGKTVGMKVTKELSDATDLPEGINDGTYVFLFDGGIWRYDKADTLQINIEDKTYRIACVPGGTNENRITLLSEGSRELAFIKDD